MESLKDPGFQAVGSEDWLIIRQIEGENSLWRDLSLERAKHLRPSCCARSKSCEDNQLRMVRWRLRQALREGPMRINRRTAFKSSDLILIVGAVLAIAMMISAMRHNRKNLQQGLGMQSGVTAPAA